MPRDADPPLVETYPDMVVVVPGILGSSLVRDGQPLWDLRPSRLRSTLAAAARGRLIYRTDADDQGQASDGAVPGRIVRGLRILPGLTALHGYAGLLATLRSRRALPGQVLEFPYDWRLSCRGNARLLERRVEEALDGWRRRIARPDARVVVIAHSMGGLIARHFCEVGGGWEVTRRLVTIGTPHRGSPAALLSVVQGHRLGPLDVSESVRSWPSMLELLPTYRAVESEGGYVTVEESGLLDRYRLASGRTLHTEIADAVGARTAGGRDVDLCVVLNRFLPTVPAIRVGAAGLEPVSTYAGRAWGGDGTVPGFAATPAEWDDDRPAVLVPDRHGRMQDSAAVTVHALEGASPARDLALFRTPPGAALEDQMTALDAPWALTAGETATLTVSTARQHTRLGVTVTNLEDNAQLQLTTISGPDGSAVLETPRLPAGVYELEVHGGPGSPLIPDVRHTVVLEPGQ